MLDNFIFSLNSVLPIFIIIALGYFLKYKNTIDEKIISAFNNIVFTLALPMFLFKDVATTDFESFFDINLLLFSFSITIIIFVLCWAFAMVFISDKKSIGSFVQGSMRSNYALIGIPIIKNIMGENYTGAAALIITFIVPLYNLLSVVILSIFSTDQSEKGKAIKQSIKNIFLNPLIIAIFVGLIFSFFNIKLPEYALKSVNYIGNLATPLALLAIGGSIDLKSSLKGLKLAFVASSIKLIITPCIIIPIAIFFGFRGEDLVILFVMLSAPASVSSYIMASKMKNNSVLASNIILITTLFSVLTFTLGIFILTSIGVIN